MRGRALLFALLTLLAACGRKRTAGPVVTPPQRQPSLVVLLEDPEKKTGRIEIRNAGGTLELTHKNSAAAIASADQAPSLAAIDATEIQRRFGSLLAALPEAEVRYTLYFEENSDRVTAESARLLASVSQTIHARQSTFVNVTGHTDTTGAGELNYRLGLRRAERLTEILRESGVAAETVWIRSHGEGDLLIPTPDNVAEPRNRRVEVVIR